MGAPRSAQLMVAGIGEDPFGTKIITGRNDRHLTQGESDEVHR